MRCRGARVAPLWRLAGASTVEVVEATPAPPRAGGERTLTFAQTAGTSPAGTLAGTWTVAEEHAVGNDATGGKGRRSASSPLPCCTLSYEATLSPRDGFPPLPTRVASRLVGEGAAAALRAVAAAAEAHAASDAGPPWLEGDAGRAASAVSQRAPFDPGGRYGPRELWGAASLPFSQWAQPDFLGVDFLPLPRAAPPEPPPPPPQAQAQPSAPPSAPPASPPASPPPPPLQEVHLRRLDTRGEAVRRAVASVRVAAPLSFAWAALADASLHPCFMPSVAAVQRVRRGGGNGGDGGGDGGDDETRASSSSASSASASADAPRPNTPAVLPGASRLRYLCALPLPYASLHGAAVFDVLARSGLTGGARELQFRAAAEGGGGNGNGGGRAAGGVGTLRGRWLLSPDFGAEEEEAEVERSQAQSGQWRSGGGGGQGAAAASAEAAAAAAPACLLKLALEARAPLGPASDAAASSSQASPGIAVSPSSAAGVAAAAVAAAPPSSPNPLPERCVYEDLPRLLGCVRARAEALYSLSLEPEGSSARASAPPDMLASSAAAAAERLAAAPPLEAAEALAGDPDALRRALIAAGFGSGGVMPRPEALAAAPELLRTAISVLGGAAAAAAAVGWAAAAKARKPRGYWDRLDNCSREISAFVADAGLPPGVLPSRAQLIAAGRSDLAKLPERWGGASALASALGYTPWGARRARMRGGVGAARGRVGYDIDGEDVDDEEIEEEESEEEEDDRYARGRLLRSSEEAEEEEERSYLRRRPAGALAAAAAAADAAAERGGRGGGGGSGRAAAPPEEPVPRWLIDWLEASQAEGRRAARGRKRAADRGASPAAPAPAALDGSDSDGDADEGGAQGPPPPVFAHG